MNSYLVIKISTLLCGVEENFTKAGKTTDRYFIAIIKGEKLCKRYHQEIMVVV